MAINGTGLDGLRHAEAIGIFKGIKSGPVALQVCRRQKKSQPMYFITNLNSSQIILDSNIFLIYFKIGTIPSLVRVTIFFKRPTKKPTDLMCAVRHLIK